MVQIGANQPGELCQAMRRAECECRLASARSREYTISAMHDAPHRKALADTIERMADTDVRNLAKFLVEVITQHLECHAKFWLEFVSHAQAIQLQEQCGVDTVLEAHAIALGHL